MSSKSQSTREYVPAVTAARLLSFPAKQVAALAAKGLITVRRLPGCDPRYLLSDVQRLAEKYTTAAKAEGSETSA